MIKQFEIIDSNSCWNKARVNERMFILLARDKTAPSVIRYWVRARIDTGLNNKDDHQITEALECARSIELGI